MKFIFLKKITLHFSRSHSQILLKDYVFWQFSINPGYVGVYGKLRNHSKIAPGGLRNSYCDFFPKNLVFDKLAFSLNMAVFLHPNGPKCLRNE